MCVAAPSWVSTGLGLCVCGSILPASQFAVGQPLSTVTSPCTKHWLTDQNFEYTHIKTTSVKHGSCCAQTERWFGEAEEKNGLAKSHQKVLFEQRTPRTSKTCVYSQTGSLANHALPQKKVNKTVLDPKVNVQILFPGTSVFLCDCSIYCAPLPMSPWSSQSAARF